MIIKRFKDNYDAEFVNLMLDIQNLIYNFSKSDKLKINSWAKILCIPTTNIEFKKDRNLYAIKLLDNMLNNKLEEPFNKFAKHHELKQVNPIIIRAQLTKKFFDHITKYESYDYIPNYENINFSPSNIRANNVSNMTQINFNKRNNNNKLYLDFDNQFLLVPMSNRRNKSSYKLQKNNFSNNNNYINYTSLRPSDLLLIKNQQNFPYYNKSTLMTLKNSIYTKYEARQLQYIVDRLNEKRIENNDLICNQKQDINKLKKKLSFMQKKLKKMFDF